MNRETLDRFKELLAIPNYSNHEDLVIEHLVKYGVSKEYMTQEDNFGNVYFTKGVLDEGESYPCVVAHMDSVHRIHVDLMERGLYKDIRESVEGDKTILKAYHPIDQYDQIGISGDDLCGVFTALEVLDTLDKGKAAFFINEEQGCHGSKRAHKDFFSDVAYAIQSDGPTNDWVSLTCGGVNLFNKEFAERVIPILEQHGQTNYSNDPYTDVMALKGRFDFNTINIFAGYWNYHRPSEYIVVEDVDNAISLAKDIISEFGNIKSEFINNQPNYLLTEGDDEENALITYFPLELA